MNEKKSHNELNQFDEEKFPECELTSTVSRSQMQIFKKRVKKSGKKHWCKIGFDLISRNGITTLSMYTKILASNIMRL